MAANFVLALHAAFVAFVVLGLPAIWIGATLHRRWSANRRFRLLHLAAIAVVVAESLLGLDCPLTLLEDRLRGVATNSGFIERALHAVMFWAGPPWAFTAAYVAFGALVGITWLIVPPRPQAARERKHATP